MIQLESVPTFIFELAGANGRIAEAEAKVNSQATLTTTGETSDGSSLKSPYADARLPSASIEHSRDPPCRPAG